MHPAAVSTAGGKDRHKVLAHQPTVEECAEDGGVTGVRYEFESQQMLRGKSDAILFPALMSFCFDEVQITSNVLGEFVEAQFRRE
jgi:hypothetical protein